MAELDITIPKGFIKLNVEVFYNYKDDYIVILGDPSEDSNHNCDLMGCGSFDHALIRIPVKQINQIKDGIIIGSLKDL